MLGCCCCCEHCCCEQTQLLCHPCSSPCPPSLILQYLFLHGLHELHGRPTLSPDCSSPYLDCSLPCNVPPPPLTAPGLLLPHSMPCLLSTLCCPTSASGCSSPHLVPLLPSPPPLPLPHFPAPSVSPSGGAVSATHHACLMWQGEPPEGCSPSGGVASARPLSKMQAQSTCVAQRQGRRWGGGKGREGKSERNGWVTSRVQSTQHVSIAHVHGRPRR